MIICRDFTDGNGCRVTCTLSYRPLTCPSMGLETIDRLLLNHAGVWRGPRGIFHRGRSARTNERAALRWGVIYVAEGGNCPRILCPACPRGHTFQPAVSTVNNVPRVVPKRFLVSAVILAINRRPVYTPAPSLKYRVSCPRARVFHSLLLRVHPEPSLPRFPSPTPFVLRKLCDQDEEEGF